MTRLSRGSTASLFAVAALFAVGLAACSNSGSTLDADGPTTSIGGRFPVAVVPTTGPVVTTPFGGHVVTTTTTSTTAKPNKGGGSPTTTSTTTKPARVRPAETPLPSPRTEVSGAAWQSLVIVVGGADDTGAPTARVDAYDPTSGNWTRGPDLPQPLKDVAVAVLGDDLWAVGGFSVQGDQSIAQATTYFFRPGNTGWTSGPMLHTPRGGAAIGVLNDTMVVLGGQTTDGGALDSVETLAKGGTDWGTAAPLTQQRAFATTVVGGGRIYALGGQTDGASTALDSVESWNLTAATWHAEPSLVTKRSGAAASGLCVAGGQNANGTVGSVECIAAHKWSVKYHLLLPRHGPAAVALGGWLHVIGGTPSSGASASAVHEIFDLTT